MAAQVRFTFTDSDGQRVQRSIDIRELLALPFGNVTLRQALGQVVPEGTEVSGIELIGAGGERAGFNLGATVGEALDFEFGEQPPGQTEAIEQSGEAGQRAAFGQFLTGGGVGPGRSFARQAGERNLGQRAAGFELNQLLNPGSFSGENAFADFLGTQNVGGGRQNLSDLFSQLRGLDRSTLGRGGVDQVGGIAGALSGRDAIERGQLGNAANQFLSSSFSPLINRTRRSSADLGSDFLQSQAGGFGGDFGQFLDFRLGLDRLRG